MSRCTTFEVVIEGNAASQISMKYMKVPNKWKFYINGNFTFLVYPYFYYSFGKAYHQLPQ